MLPFHRSSTGQDADRAPADDWISLQASGPLVGGQPHLVDIAGCVHPAIYVIDGDSGDTAQGWCDLCREVAHQQEQELMALGAHRKRSRKAEGTS